MIFAAILRHHTRDARRRAMRLRRRHYYFTHIFAAAITLMPLIPIIFRHFCAIAFAYFAILRRRHLMPLSPFSFRLPFSPPLFAMTLLLPVIFAIIIFTLTLIIDAAAAIYYFHFHDIIRHYYYAFFLSFSFASDPATIHRFSHATHASAPPDAGRRATMPPFLPSRRRALAARRHAAFMPHAGRRRGCARRHSSAAYASSPLQLARR